MTKWSLALASGVAVFHHQVLVEKAKSLFAGRGGQAYEVGVKVFQHLAPQVVNAAVRLVGDDDVKGLDREAGVVADRFRLGEPVAQIVDALLVVFGCQLAALEHAEQALNRADGDAGRGVELVAGQVLDDVSR